MRRASRVDANQSAIVKALREIGATVQVLSAVGQGCPDLAVGYHGVNVLLEAKDGSKTPGNRVLTADEAKWHKTWGGQVAVVLSPEDAQRVVIRVAMEAQDGR